VSLIADDFADNWKREKSVKCRSKLLPTFLAELLGPVSTLGYGQAEESLEVTANPEQPTSATLAKYYRSATNVNSLLVKGSALDIP